MVVKNIIETVQLLFPNIGHTYILKEIDKVQKQFCAETKILRGRGLLDSISTNTAWELPSDFEQLYDVTYYDINGNALYEADYNDTYKWEVEFGKLYVYSLTSNVITGLSDGINACYIHYYKAPTNVNDVNDELSIPYEFDEAIESKVLSRFIGLFSKEADKWNLVQYYDSVYRKGVRDAKIKKNTHDVEGYNLQSYEYAGRAEMPRRSDSDTTSVSTISAISNLYEKYVKFTIEGTTVTQDSVSGFTDTVSAVATVTGIVTITSSAEFDNSFFVESNNKDHNITNLTATTITMDFFSIIGTAVIEVYKKK